MAEPIDHMAAACRVAADLATLEIGHALVGGVAVMLHGRARLTKDVDFAVQVATEAVAEQTIHELGGRGYRIGQVMLDKQTGRLTTVRLFTPAATTDAPDCDLLLPPVASSRRSCGLPRC